MFFALVTSKLRCWLAFVVEGVDNFEYNDFVVNSFFVGNI